MIRFLKRIVRRPVAAPARQPYPGNTADALTIMINARRRRASLVR